MTDDGQLSVRYLGQVERERDQVSAAVREAIADRSLGLVEIMAELATAGLDVSRSGLQRTLHGMRGELQIAIGEHGKKTFCLPSCPGAQEVPK